MSSQHASKLREHLHFLEKILKSINAVCNDAFGATAASLAEEEFLKGIPHRDLYRHHKLEYVDTFALLTDEIAGEVSFEQRMESYFYLAAEYALMGKPDKMNVFVRKIDWKCWDVTKSQDPAVVQAYRELLARSQELRFLQAH